MEVRRYYRAGQPPLIPNHHDRIRPVVTSVPSPQQSHSLMTRIRPCGPHSGHTGLRPRRGDSWAPIPEMFRTSACLPPPWEEQFGPLRIGTTDDLVVVAQIGQSLDGRIATLTGHSHYINGPAGRAHLHRLRSL